VTKGPEGDVTIPDEMGFGQGVLSFATLSQAFVLGDFLTLNEAEHKVIRLHLEDDLAEGLSRLSGDIEFERRSTVPP
jgi:hypothetical protein